ncbi:cysteine--tRNA ligase [bacterium]|nr:cysteine--tRNA ligase [bacterium]
MSLMIYNTLTGKKEEFKPVAPGKAGMYVCGVTVYDLCHLGHARGALVFDVVRRYLQYKGFQVTYVRNFTDVDDKIINRAKEEGCDHETIANRYIDAYKKDFEQLGVMPADIEPKATEHIPEMIGMVKSLIEKGFAYEREGDVFFSVRRFAPYGRLSGREADQMMAGARVDIDERKEDPLDFALWKGSKPGEPRWETPWGQGRPGWHIECSAMSQKYLGGTFDIHGGGKDLIFPHHENEIAQSEAATGKPFVRYWMHNGFVSINKEKMSKSLKNFFTIRDVLLEYPAEAVRHFLISTHYRSPIDFTPERIVDSQKAIERVYTAFQNIDLLGSPGDGEIKLSHEWAGRINYLKTQFEASMDDDFNTAASLGHIFEFIKEINISLKDNTKSPQTICDLHTAKKTVQELGHVLSLFQGYEQKIKTDHLADSLMDILIDLRQISRQNKDWAMADRIRDRLSDLNISLEDRHDGKTIWKIKK